MAGGAVAQNPRGSPHFSAAAEESSLDSRRAPVIDCFSSGESEAKPMRQRWVHTTSRKRGQRHNRRQLEFSFRRRGGARKNAGRKPKVPRKPGARPNVPHLKRPAL